ncbi:MAG: hypothetical protein U5K00_03290 [Melioribacteraceae bacterium]|nr:hypothetical protein [Melioribacteraceae bacterium]
MIPTSLGKDFIGSDLEIFLLDSEIDSLNQNSSSFLADSISFGPSSRLILGNVENRKSTMLMRFGVILPDSIRTAVQDKNLNILSAEVELRPVYKIGDPRARRLISLSITLLRIGAQTILTKTRLLY